MTCEHCDEGQWPQYGVAPHECFYKIPGAVLGQSRILPQSEWPARFQPDPDNPNCGVWQCPNCWQPLKPNSNV